MSVRIGMDGPFFVKQLGLQDEPNLTHGFIVQRKTAPGKQLGRRITLGSSFYALIA